ncbi:MAG: 3-hydroxyacyl-CoA dehydrogenase family protein, partial [Chloroflexota bacterium]
GKMPIVVNDGPGFVVNRLLLQYMNEAVMMLSEGVAMEELDRIGKAFGFPMGPFTLFDVVGLDTAALCGRTMYEAFPDRVAVLPIVPALVKQGRLGQKTGAGFYAYKNRKAKGQSDPKTMEIIEPFIRQKGDYTRDEITMRLMLPMLVEASRVIEVKIARNARDIDIGMIFALGFPPFKGGLLFWADTIGAPKIVEMLKPYESLGKRMEPTSLLLEMAKDNRKFYDL